MGHKKPQQAQQQADVVPGAAQHGMQCISQRTLERIAIESAVALVWLVKSTGVAAQAT